MSKIKVLRTVLPTEVLTQEEWLSWVKAGIAVKQNSSLDNARDMNTQYREAGLLSPKYKQLIDDFAEKTLN